MTCCGCDYITLLWILTSKSVRTQRERTNIEVFGAELWCRRGRLVLFWCALTAQIKSVSNQYKNAETLTFKLAIAKTVYLQSAARRHAATCKFHFLPLFLHWNTRSAQLFFWWAITRCCFVRCEQCVCVARRQFFGNTQYTPRTTASLCTRRFITRVMRCVCKLCIHSCIQHSGPNYQTLPFMYPWSAGENNKSSCTIRLCGLCKYLYCPCPYFESTPSM